MPRIIICAFFIFLHTQVLALPARITSGDHEGFTRLVFYLPDTRSYTLKNSRERKISTITFNKGNLEWDINDVFDRISRNRISTITVNNKFVEIHLECDCGLIAFRFRPNILVVDVRDFNPKTKISSPLSGDGHFTSASKSVSLPEPNISFEGRNLLIDALENSLKLSASTDLLDMSPELNNNFLITPSTENFSINTSTEDKEISRFTSCFPVSWFDIEAIGTAQTFYKTLTYMRLSAVNIDGDNDYLALIGLARFLVTNGLGLEAIALISNLETEETNILIEMSKIIEGKSSGQVFTGQLDCPTPSALWAVLSNGFSTKEDAEFHGEKILNQYLSLSPQLQSLLFRSLSDKFLEVRAYDLAGQLAPQLSRQGLITKSNHDLLNARMPENDSQKTAIALTGISNSNFRLAPDSLRSLFSKYETGVYADENDRILLKSFFKQAGEFDPSPELAKARARVAVLELDQTFALKLLRTTTTMDGPDRQSLLDETVRYASTEYPDIAFLKLIFALETDEINKLTKDGLAFVSERMKSLGITNWLAEVQRASPIVEDVAN